MRQRGPSPRRLGEFSSGSEGYFTNPTSCEGEGTRLEASFIRFVGRTREVSRDEDAVRSDRRLWSFLLPRDVHSRTDDDPCLRGDRIGCQSRCEADVRKRVRAGVATLKKAVVTLPEGIRSTPRRATGSVRAARRSSKKNRISRRAAQRFDAGFRYGVDSRAEGKGVGWVLLAEPAPLGKRARPFDSLIALYVVIRFPQRGIVAKLAGKAPRTP